MGQPRGPGATPPATPPSEPPPPGSTPTDRGRRRVTPRALGFALALLLLVAAVPALGWVGQQRLLDSRAGQVVENGGGPTDPGYRALVVPTPTAMVMHLDDSDDVASVTVLALGAGQAGGTVLQVPLQTEMRNVRYYFDRLQGIADDGDLDQLAREVEDRLNVAIPEVIQLTDDDLASLVGPVAPLAIDNSDPVISDSGKEFPAGPVSLAAEDVGPFLRATSDEETELGHLARSETVWDAWLTAIAEATGDDSVGVATTGIGPFLRDLADGDPVVETLDVEPPPGAETNAEGEVPLALTPAAGFNEQVIDAVPYPRPPRLGRRWSLKVLNGVDGEPIPRPLLRTLILQGASLETTGNAADFGRERTLIEYSGRDWADEARAARLALGGTAEVEQMSAARADTEDEAIVVTLGQDALDFAASQSTGEEDDGG